MINIIIVGEGQTEESFVRDVLAPAFRPDQIYLEPRLISTSPGYYGGALSFQRVLRYLRNTLHQRADTYVTTLFDLYRVKNDFPGYADCQHHDPLQRAACLEQHLAQAVIQEALVRDDRFLAYFQLYEFEALLFTDVNKLTEIEPTWSAFSAVLQAVRAQATSPEHINDDPQTHPSARLTSILQQPSYRKTLHGPLAAENIGLAAMAQACAHFAAWLARLRSLSPLA